MRGRKRSLIILSNKALVLVPLLLENQFPLMNDFESFWLLLSSIPLVNGPKLWLYFFFETSWCN
jgi:hypothetical protein